MKRSDFIKTLGITMAATPLLGLKDWDKLVRENENTPKAPALFIGHGNPMNALADNTFTKALAKLGTDLEKPKAILVVSAHWLTTGTWVSTTPKPETIYDFGGFPKEMYEIKYPATGSPEYAAEVKTLLKDKTTVQEHATMGLDHGAWTVLKHIYPNADVPVFQMSIDYYQPPQYHYELAKYLSALRSKGVMILTSGNIVHNLGNFSWDENAAIYDWAQEFDTEVKTYIDDNNHAALIDYTKLKSSSLAVPTNDHYLPLLYALAQRESTETVKHIYEGFQNGSVSMRCVQVG